jgi:hypothetical protein
MATHAHTTDPAERRSSRRALFAGAAVLPVMAAAVAAAAPLASPEPINPDADLIALCGRHAGLIAAFNACEQDSGDDNPEWVAYKASMDAIDQGDVGGAAEGGVAAGGSLGVTLLQQHPSHPDGSIDKHWLFERTVSVQRSLFGIGCTLQGTHGFRLPNSLHAVRHQDHCLIAA